MPMNTVVCRSSASMASASSPTAAARQPPSRTPSAPLAPPFSTNSILTSSRPCNAPMTQPRTRPNQPKRTVSIIGTGSYLPERVLSNYDLEKLVETSDEWITSRTGIRERRIAAEDEHTSDLAAKAALSALENAGISAEEIDLILVA